MSKNVFLVGITTLMISMCSVTLNAQVGVNTEDPHATLDIVAKKTDGTTAEGFISPRLTGDQIKAADANYGTAQNGTLVYATVAVTTPSAKTINVKKPGYYYYDAPNSVWVAVGAATDEWFYMPAFLIPTDRNDLVGITTYDSGTSTFSVNLYTEYTSQFGSGLMRTNRVSSPSAAVALPVAVSTASGLDYYVTYFDDTVFDAVAVDDAGVLTYKIKPDAVITEQTYMNIIFKVK